jgi:cyclophilin family peptidyl-prolyl cis-trans isomerase
LIENSPDKDYVFMDVSINGMIQKVVFELFSDIAPKTCDNFQKLCNGVFTNKQGEKLSYVGTEF